MKKAPSQMSKKDKVELKTNLQRMGADIDEWIQAGMPVEVTVEPVWIAPWIQSVAGRLAGHLSAGDHFTSVIDRFLDEHPDGDGDALYEWLPKCDPFSFSKGTNGKVYVSWKDPNTEKWSEPLERKQVVERLRKAKIRRKERRLPRRIPNDLDPPQSIHHPPVETTVNEKQRNVVIAAFQRALKNDDDQEIRQYSAEDLRRVDALIGGRDLNEGWRILLRNRIKELEDEQKTVRSNRWRVVEWSISAFIGIIVGLVLAHLT